MQLQPNILFHNHYTLICLIGRGGFSEVWLAKDKYTDLDVALKIYASNGGLDDDGVEAFSNEIRRVYNLNHPNLLKPQHFDVCEGMPYLVMPYCANGAITKRIGKVSEDEVWNIIRDVSAGLAYLHEHRIVHQDIKPDNILQDADGHYLITDFGISARTRATLSKTQPMNNSNSGTAAYMAPERFSTNPAPIYANDVWAFGATLYELITGNVPFGDGTLPGGLLQKNGADIPDIGTSISDKLQETIFEMLQVDPAKRCSIQHIQQSAMPPVGKQETIEEKDEIGDYIGILNYIIENDKGLHTKYRIIVVCELIIEFILTFYATITFPIMLMVFVFGVIKPEPIDNEILSWIFVVFLLCLFCLLALVGFVIASAGVSAVSLELNRRYFVNKAKKIFSRIDCSDEIRKVVNQHIELWNPFEDLYLRRVRNEMPLLFDVSKISLIC